MKKKRFFVLALIFFFLLVAPFVSSYLPSKEERMLQDCKEKCSSVFPLSSESNMEEECLKTDCDGDGVPDCEWAKQEYPTGVAYYCTISQQKEQFLEQKISEQKLFERNIWLSSFLILTFSGIALVFKAIKTKDEEKKGLYTAFGVILLLIGFVIFIWPWVVLG